MEENSKYKYPRTFHVPWSHGISSDDRVHKDLSFFEGKEIIITEKFDGENTTLMNNCIFARSLDSADHLSRHWVKGLWGKIKHEIPDNWRVCGENLYARHSLEYENLVSYFLVFSIWDENNFCISWDETTDLCNVLNLNYVSILWRGMYNEEFVKKFKIDIENHEGFVIRLTDCFHYNDFDRSVAKWVRKNHVTTDSHWMLKKVIPNKLCANIPVKI